MRVTAIILGLAFAALALWEASSTHYVGFDEVLALDVTQFKLCLTVAGFVALVSAAFVWPNPRLGQYGLQGAVLICGAGTFLTMGSPVAKVAFLYSTLFCVAALVAKRARAEVETTTGETFRSPANLVYDYSVDLEGRRSPWMDAK